MAINVDHEFKEKNLQSNEMAECLCSGSETDSTNEQGCNEGTTKQRKFGSATIEPNEFYVPSEIENSLKGNGSDQHCSSVIVTDENVKRIVNVSGVEEAPEIEVVLEQNVPFPMSTEDQKYVNNDVSVLHVEPGNVDREVEIVHIEKGCSDVEIVKVIPAKKRNLANDHESLKIVDIQGPAQIIFDNCTSNEGESGNSQDLNLVLEEGK